MHIGVIPARKGSTRIPGKNKKRLIKNSLWSEAFNKSLKTMDESYVNTDDFSIVSPGECHYIRPEKLSGSEIRIDDVLLEMAKTLAFNDYDFIHLFQPTSPFTSKKTIDSAILGLDNGDLDSIQSVVPVSNTFHAYSQRTIKEGIVKFVFPELREEAFNSQLKPEHYSFAGYVAFRVGSLREYGNIWGKKSGAIVVNQIEAIDIDTMEDIEYVRLIAAAKPELLW